MQFEIGDNIGGGNPGNLKWDCDPRDIQIIAEIAQRICAVMVAVGKPPEQYNYMGFLMDWSTVHCNGRPLDLQRALRLEPGPLLDDAVAIHANLDRSTGKLPTFVRLHCDVNAGMIQH